MTAAPYPPNSRYFGVPVVSRTGDDGTTEVYLARRILPAPDRYVPLGHRRIAGGERPDTLAHDAYGDPALWWRVVDADGAADPARLTDAEGRLVMIPLPLEITGHGTA
ncbi:hypothetical protein [Streptomyces sp. NBC_00299]|uniref:hypothetical protein n=1 Tax=Streptomyces sp. NBC_00299 TaxID=2975705 RepID=UPI002E2DA337|nr:hypothetical protein [Streptomyces sp. NBC_00299]